MRKLLPLLVGALRLRRRRPPQAASAAPAKRSSSGRSKAASPASRSIASTSAGSGRAGSFADTAILYDAGSVIYVNRPRSGARML